MKVCRHSIYLVCRLITPIPSCNLQARCRERWLVLSIVKDDQVYLRPNKDLNMSHGQFWPQHELGNSGIAIHAYPTILILNYWSLWRVLHIIRCLELNTPKSNKLICVKGICTATTRFDSQPPSSIDNYQITIGQDSRSSVEKKTLSRSYSALKIRSKKEYRSSELGLLNLIGSSWKHATRAWTFLLLG